MKCPHCGDSVHEEWYASNVMGYVFEDLKVAFEVKYMDCPACTGAIVRYSEGAPEVIDEDIDDTLIGLKNVTSSFFVLPRVPNVSAQHQSVPADIAEDLKEAMLVLPFSSKASAALSRRCLQNILLVAAGVNPKLNLVDQIDEAVTNHGFTQSLRKLLTAVRQVGNYAAHPTLDKNSGAIINVEPGEAELNISVLEALIDFFYIRPAEEQAKIDEINKKLAAAGKPLIQ